MGAEKDREHGQDSARVEDGRQAPLSMLATRGQDRRRRPTRCIGYGCEASACARACVDYLCNKHTARSSNNTGRRHATGTAQYIQLLAAPPTRPQPSERATTNKGPGGRRKLSAKPPSGTSAFSSSPHAPLPPTTREQGDAMPC
ncbi:hypothetical protein CDD83_2234 [Cordyceps sp. RAO-2017]|nr:hypothetical protein CDD83_2234 [Cordyceps sp. RAO-2017]